MSLEFLGLDFELKREDKEDKLGAGVEVRTGQGGTEVNHVFGSVRGVGQVPGELGRVEEHEAVAADEGLPAGEHHGLRRA
ncbi:hypothetical protein SRABI128_05209 [Microbacterium sp. Bi128]|nr:hypothetical protein SRABI128_05209 [Microbacterium sp. Bi128]